MVTVSTYDAKTTLSALLQQVEAGEEIVITRHGNPVAKLVPYQQPEWKPFFGPMPNDVRIHRLPPGEDVAPLFPDGVPFHPDDPV